MSYPNENNSSSLLIQPELQTKPQSRHILFVFGIIAALLIIVVLSALVYFQALKVIGMKASLENHPVPVKNFEEKAKATTVPKSAPVPVPVSAPVPITKVITP